MGTLRSDASGRVRVLFLLFVQNQTTTLILLTGILTRLRGGALCRLWAFLHAETQISTYFVQSDWLSIFLNIPRAASISLDSWIHSLFFLVNKHETPLTSLKWQLSAACHANDLLTNFRTCLQSSRILSLLLGTYFMLAVYTYIHVI